MVFPIVMSGCESWTIKKVKHWRIDAFELWCCRRLLRVPWAARKSNQSILKKIDPEYSLEGLMLKLKLLYFGHLRWRASSLEKTLMLEKIEDGGEVDNRQWDGWMASLTQWTWVWANSGRWWRTGNPGVLWSMRVQRVGHDLTTNHSSVDGHLGCFHVLAIINSSYINLVVLMVKNLPSVSGNPLQKEMATHSSILA